MCMHMETQNSPPSSSCRRVPPGSQVASAEPVLECSFIVSPRLRMHDPPWHASSIGGVSPRRRAGARCGGWRDARAAAGWATRRRRPRGRPMEDGGQAWEGSRKGVGADSSAARRCGAGSSGRDRRRVRHCVCARACAWELGRSTADGARACVRCSACRLPLCAVPEKRRTRPAAVLSHSKRMRRAALLQAQDDLDRMLPPDPGIQLLIFCHIFFSLIGRIRSVLKHWQSFVYC